MQDDFHDLTNKSIEKKNCLEYKIIPMIPPTKSQINNSIFW